MWRACAACAKVRARAAVAISAALPPRATSTISDAPFGARSQRRMDGHTASSALPFQPHAAPAALADRALSDQLDARSRQRINEFHQRIHVSPDEAVTCFHALNRGQ